MTEQRDESQGDQELPSAADEPNAVEAPTTDEQAADDRGVTVPQGEDRGISVPQKDDRGVTIPQGDAEEDSD